MLEYRIVPTSIGFMSILAGEKGVKGIQFPVPSERGAVWMLGRKAAQALRSDDLMPDLAEKLQRYFDGEKVEFTEPLDLSGATPFQQRIWEAARLIPYGETRSYGWVAAQAGNPLASRAAGQALGRNPIPILVPCHRVIAADGGIGGFSSGLVIKRRLLDLERNGRS